MKLLNKVVFMISIIMIILLLLNLINLVSLKLKTLLIIGLSINASVNVAFIYTEKKKIN